jgi:hypothetical protein
MRHAKRQQMAQHAAQERRENKKRSWALISGLAAFFLRGNGIHRLSTAGPARHTTAARTEPNQAVGDQ